MVTYNNSIISSGLSVDVIDYLVSLYPSRFVKTSNISMTIDNICEFTFDWNTNYNFGLSKDGTSILSLSGSTYGGSLGVMVAVSDTLIYFRFCRKRDSEDLPNILMIISDGTNFMYGGTNNSNDIYSISFSNLTDTTSGYKIPKILNFTAPAGTIGYSSVSPITANGQTMLLPEDMWSCSTVSLYQTIALPNGKLYFTLGTNTMVEIPN